MSSLLDEIAHDEANIEVIDDNARSSEDLEGLARTRSLASMRRQQLNKSKSETRWNSVNHGRGSESNIMALGSRKPNNVRVASTDRRSLSVTRSRSDNSLLKIPKRTQSPRITNRTAAIGTLRGSQKSKGGTKKSAKQNAGWDRSVLRPLPKREEKKMFDRFVTVSM